MILIAFRRNKNSELNLILKCTEIIHGYVVIYLNSHVEYKILFICDSENKMTFALFQACAALQMTS